MSELKARTARSIAEEEEMLELGADCPIEPAQVYIKSEADKVIAEKDKQIEELKHQRDGAFGLANLGLTLEDLTKLARKEIDRQKYKRCLAMALYWVAVSYQCVDDKHRQRAVKHHYKWLEFAEEFKGAK